MDYLAEIGKKQRQIAMIRQTKADAVTKQALIAHLENEITAYTGYQLAEMKRQEEAAKAQGQLQLGEETGDAPPPAPPDDTQRDPAPVRRKR